MGDDARVDNARVLVRFPVVFLAVAADVGNVEVIAIRGVVAAVGSERDVSGSKLTAVVGRRHRHAGGIDQGQRV